MQEIAVSISDFALAALAAGLTYRLSGRNTELVRVQKWFGMTLGAVAVSAFLGGIAHGFLPETTLAGILVWRATLISIGVAAYSTLMIAALLLYRPGTVERVRWLGLGLFAIYVGIILFETHDFAAALTFYVPTSVLLLIAFVVRWRRESDEFALDGIIAIALTLIAGTLQHFRVAIHPVYFDHNVLYHVVQGFGVIILYRSGSRWLNGAEKPELQPRAA